MGLKSPWEFFGGGLDGFVANIIEHGLLHTL